ncbi:hypothetical protein FD04_GL001504 [Secundilactobacillus odoratitofui DSM 19909 = JCM 15043]|uniref:HTH araC/xylS-type domain-containing protein n=1 Tax=Secundilactobacillus odoratitofui DSM 19909 = JCM 15043 TaxID=1423776 RepID=A0A0R1LWA1_9LACO|nr:AraC family transcriptional regulator [Secundilactobacillus odoratitofui]KRK97476.1 hypothetical protein FD04_GL001504 [Secundilactobacillus odoratitofui DSM 19909 = JCM 15043]
MEDYSEYIPDNEKGIQPLQGIYFNNPSNIAKELYYYPMWGAEYQVTYPYVVDRQYMNAFILFWVEEGELSFTFNDRQDFVAKKDSLIILDCKKRNHYYTNSSSKFMFFHFNGPQIQLLYDYITKNNQNSFEMSASNKTLFIQLLNTLQTKNYANRDIVNSELLYKILINLTSNIPSNQFDRSGLHQSPQLVKDALNYLDTHYAETVTIQTLCHHLGVSSALLSRTFRANTNNSIHHYLTSTRLSHAQQLLTRYPDISIAEVALKCGFHDASHLNKIFRADIGMSPSEFRRMCF